MNDKVAAFTVCRVVFVAMMYTNVCGLHWMKRSLLPSGTRIMQLIATQNTKVKVHTAQYAALYSVGYHVTFF